MPKNALVYVTLYKFGQYIYPLVTQVQAPSPARVGLSDTPGRAGSYAGKRHAASRSVKIAGTLKGASFDDLLYQFSRLVSAHETEGPQPLYTGRDGWYLLAQTESVDDTNRDVDHIEYEVSLICADPYYYSDILRSSPVIPGGDTSVVTFGTTYALPSVSLVVSAAPPGGRITITCVASGDSITLAPNAAETVVVDSLAETIKTSGGADRMNLFTSGRFIRLVGSPINAASGTSNQIQITTSGGAGVSNATISFRDRTL